LLAGLPGCSSSTAEPSASDAGVDARSLDAGGFDGGSTLDAAADALEPRPICERATVATSPPDVTVAKQPMSAAPAATGGTIVPGVYTLRRAVWYTDDAAVPSGTLRIAYRLLPGEWIGAFVVGTDPESTTGGRFTTDNTSITLTETCGVRKSLDGGPSLARYSSDGTQLTLLVDAGVLTTAPLVVEYTYRRQ
jgi:hypothetical protein